MAIDKEALRKRWLQEVQALMTPIDVGALIAEGILGKRKGSWYEVLDMARLPEHVQKRISEIQGSPSGERPPMVKFSKVKVSKKLERLYDKLKD